MKFPASLTYRKHSYAFEVALEIRERGVYRYAVISTPPEGVVVDGVAVHATMTYYPSDDRVSLYRATTSEGAVARGITLAIRTALEEAARRILADPGFLAREKLRIAREEVAEARASLKIAYEEVRASRADLRAAEIRESEALSEALKLSLETPRLRSVK